MKRALFISLLLSSCFVATGFAQQTITLGFTVSKTGALNVDSLEQYRGFELWRDTVNAAGGIKAAGKSYKVQFASYDDESNSKRVQQLYTRMILEDKADFLFSPYSSSLTATAAVVTEQNEKSRNRKRTGAVRRWNPQHEQAFMRISFDCRDNSAMF